MTGSPRLSVVVPTHRRPELLGRCLRALLAQQLEAADFEIVVVDDGHTADTQATVNRLAEEHADGPRLRYLRPARGHGPAVARNCGWRSALGDVIAFTDDDTIAAPDWLARGTGALAAAPGAAAACGRVRVPPLAEARDGDAVDARPTDHELMTRGLENAEFVTANAFVRRSALVAVNGFDERFTRAWREDSDLQFRLLETAGPILRCAEAVVLHPVRPERWGVSLRQQKNVFYDALLYKKHPRLYRERILPAPPWNYYLIVVLAFASALLWLGGVEGSAAVSLALAVLFVLAFAARRLRHTARTPKHLLEMVVTSAAIPFLSVYWRLRGAIHFRVAYW